MITRILIAEDDPMMARLYEKVFNFEGYQVQMAVDGQDALDKARENPPTLMILDVMMPRLNGLAALEQVKADPKLKATPVIMLTNLAGQQDAESAIAKGAVKYIIKSEHDPKDVASIVKEVLTASAAAPAPAATTAPAAAPAAVPTPAVPAATAPAPTTPAAPAIPSTPTPAAPATAPAAPATPPSEAAAPAAIPAVAPTAPAAMPAPAQAPVTEAPTVTPPSTTPSA